MNLELTKRVQRFKRDGFAVIRGCHDDKLQRAWRRIASRRLTDEPARQVFGGFVEAAPALAVATAANLQVLDFAERVMGPFVQLDGLTLVIWPPLPSTHPDNEGLHWHRDPWAHTPSNSYHRPLGINAITYLQDLDARNGPLRVIPGSHAVPFTMHTSLRRLPHRDERLIYAKAGDVIIMHNCLVHSRTPNLAGRTRSYVSVYYNLNWLRSSSSIEGTNARAIVAAAHGRGDVRLARLFGDDPQLEARTNCGFLTADEQCWSEWINEDRALLARTRRRVVQRPGQQAGLGARASPARKCR